MEVIISNKLRDNHHISIDPEIFDDYSEVAQLPMTGASGTAIYFSEKEIYLPRKPGDMFKNIVLGSFVVLKPPHDRVYDSMIFVFVGSALRSGKAGIRHFDYTYHSDQDLNGTNLSSTLAHELLHYREHETRMSLQAELGSTSRLRTVASSRLHRALKDVRRSTEEERVEKLTRQIFSQNIERWSRLVSLEVN